MARSKVIKVTSTISAVLLVLSMMALDSDSWIPGIVGVVCVAYLTLVSIANSR